MIVLAGRVIDGTGAGPIEKGIVAFEGSEIVAVCKESEYIIPPNARKIVINHGTIMPGLIDSHLHFGMGSVNQLEVYELDEIEKSLMAVKEMRDALNAGFTSVRETGGISTSFQTPLKNGWIKGPRICSAGRLISQTGGHGDSLQKFPQSLARERMSHCRIADGKEECRKTARMQFRDGAKFLKIVTTGGISSQGDGNRESQFSIEEIKVFVEEAQMHNTYVSSHSQGTMGIRNALKAGVRSIEHGMFMDDECIELMVKNNAYLVPTLMVVESYMNHIDLLPSWIREKLLMSYEEHIKSVKKCYEANVKIALGSDMMGDKVICPFGSHGKEFKKLVDIGMTNMEAIVAGTKTGSELMLMSDKVGTLESGKLADIVVCRDNPLDDIELLGNPDNIDLIVLNGEIIKNKLEN